MRGARALGSVDEHAGPAGHAPPRHAEREQRLADQLLERAQPRVHVARVARREVDDRVADELARRVIGDVAAARDLVHADAARRERVRGDEQVLAARAAAERHDRRVLEQQQRVGARAAAPRRDELVLERERIAVGDLAELPHRERHAPPYGLRSPRGSLRETCPQAIGFSTTGSASSAISRWRPSAGTRSCWTRAWSLISPSITASGRGGQPGM